MAQVVLCEMLHRTAICHWPVIGCIEDLTA
jgi:hypothetical protein